MVALFKKKGPRLADRFPSLREDHVLNKCREGMSDWYQEGLQWQQTPFMSVCGLILERARTINIPCPLACNASELTAN